MQLCLTKDTENFNFYVIQLKTVFYLDQKRQQIYLSQSILVYLKELQWHFTNVPTGSTFVEETIIFILDFGTILIYIGKCPTYNGNLGGECAF